MPACSSPCIRLLASNPVTRASRWKARSPITLLREAPGRGEPPVPAWGDERARAFVGATSSPQSRSRTGVKLKSTPQARSSEASTKPAAVAALPAAIAPLPGPALSIIHRWPRARIGGRWVKPPVRKRCTRPPSWSTQTNRSARTCFMSAHSWVSCSRSLQLRPNRIIPPVRGCSSRRRSSSVRVGPAMSRIRGAC